MALYIGSVVIDVEDVERGSQFWAAALHFVVARDADGLGGAHPQRIR